MEIVNNLKAFCSFNCMNQSTTYTEKKAFLQMLIMISLHEVKQITPINAVTVLGLILVTPATWRSNYCLDKSIGYNPWIIIQRLWTKYLKLRIIDRLLPYFFMRELKKVLSYYTKLFPLKISTSPHLSPLMS